MYPPHIAHTYIPARTHTPPSTHHTATSPRSGVSLLTIRAIGWCKSSVQTNAHSDCAIWHVRAVPMLEACDALACGSGKHCMCWWRVAYLLAQSHHGVGKAPPSLRDVFSEIVAHVTHSHTHTRALFTYELQRQLLNASLRHGEPRQRCAPSSVSIHARSL
jgi:hypothetical protein